MQGDDPTIEGAVGGMPKSQNIVTLDNDDGSYSSLSSDDSEKTFEEMMNRQNTIKSKRRRNLSDSSETSESKYIIEPPGSGNQSSDANQTSDSDENVKDALSDNVAIGDRSHDRSHDQQPQNSEEISKEENIQVSDSEGVASETMSEEIAASKPEDMSQESEILKEKNVQVSSTDQQQQNSDLYGAKPKHPFLQSGNKKISSTIEKSSSSIVPGRDEIQKAEKKLPDIKSLKFSSPLRIHQKDSNQKNVSLQLPENNKINTEDAKQSSLNNSAMKQEENEKPGLMLPSNSVTHQLPSSHMNVEKLKCQGSNRSWWCWNDNGEWRQYEEEVSKKIEKGYQSRKTSVLIQIDGKG